MCAEGSGLGFSRVLFASSPASLAHCWLPLPTQNAERTSLENGKDQKKSTHEELREKARL